MATLKSSFVAFRLRLHLLVIAGILQHTPLAFADLADTFQKEYPPARTKLEQAYGQVKITGVHIMTAMGADKTEGRRKYQFEIIRNGESVRRFQSTLESTDAGWPVGSVMINGGNPQTSFSCFKKSRYLGICRGI